MTGSEPRRSSLRRGTPVQPSATSSGPLTSDGSENVRAAQHANRTPRRRPGSQHLAHAFERHVGCPVRSRQTRRETRGCHDRSDYRDLDESLHMNLVWSPLMGMTCEEVSPIPRRSLRSRGRLGAGSVSSSTRKNGQSQILVASRPFVPVKRGVRIAIDDPISDEADPRARRECRPAPLGWERMRGRSAVDDDECFEAVTMHIRGIPCWPILIAPSSTSNPSDHKNQGVRVCRV